MTGQKSLMVRRYGFGWRRSSSGERIADAARPTKMSSAPQMPASVEVKP